LGVETDEAHVYYLGFTRTKNNLFIAVPEFKNDHLAQVAIKNFDVTAAVNFIASTFHDNASIVNCNLNINPVEKWREAMDEIKKLNATLTKKTQQIRNRYNGTPIALYNFILN
jgi:hypothetical protein